MDKKMMNISILQMSSVIADVEANIRKINQIVKQELPKVCDILVLPEVWTCGWSCSHFVQTAQNLEDSSVLDFLKNVALTYNVNIIGGSFISKQGDKFYNTCPIITRDGSLLNVYNKIHLYSYYGCDEGKYVSAGETPILVDIEGVKFGISICYDIRFPELYRAYRKAGADVLVNCAAWGASKPIAWNVMTKSRAVENQVFMVALTQCGPIEHGEYNLGQSSIIDYQGNELTFIKEKEGIVSAQIDLEEMYKFRNRCTILNDIKMNYEVKAVCEKY